MQKRIIFLVFLLFCGYITVFAQQITGTIISSEDNLGLPGAVVKVKGTTSGAVTDLDGNFKINAKVRDTLLITCIGMKPQSVMIKDQAPLNIVLNVSVKEIADVVVTALGIKRDEKALGYAVQKVSGEQIAKVKELDVVNALSGKISGVNIIQADGSIGGGGSRIVIRGESSLAGNNDPLYIINGVQGSSNDVAADDIESISVLKGPAAAALYGSKAGAGVVIITSKSGKGVKGTQVEFNSNMTYQSPLVLPEYQNQFGQGEGGQYSYFDGNGNGTFDDTRYSWGPAFDGKNRSQFTGNDPWVAYPDNVKNFYQLGHIYVNNVSISKSADNSNFRFSYTNTDQKGILPNTGLQINRFDLNSEFAITKKLKLNAGINFANNFTANSQQVDPRFTPRSINLEALKDYWVPGMEGKQQLSYRRSTNNEYFILNENTRSNNDNKTILSLSVQYDPTKDLSIIGRYGMNYYNSDSYAKNAYSTYSSGNPRSLEGYYSNSQYNNTEKTAEFLATYTKDISVINAKFSVGGTHYRREANYIGGSIQGLMYSDLYNLNNRNYPITVGNSITKLERNSLYSFLNLGYQGKLYLDVTARNDWSSTLHPSNNSFFYPSFAFSAVMNEILNLPQEINFWKIRASWAQVGKDIPEAYFTTSEKYSWNTNETTGEVYPTASDIKYDPYLKPEITTGKEIGTDIRLFNNRLGFDVALYQSMTKNQILKTAVSSSTGFSYFMMNAGKIESKGIEVTVNAVPVKTKDVEWNVQLNWSMDRTSVKELIDSLPSISKSQSVNSFLYIEDRVGQRRGTFYGQGYVRTPDGDQVFSLSGDTRLTDRKALGNYNPDWMASFNSDLKYKNFSFSFLLDLRWGGLIYNEIERRLNLYGLSKASAMNNRVGIVPKGYVEEDGVYRKLTLDDLEKYGKIGGMSGQEYWANMMEETCPENELIDDTYLKLRELRLGYDLPKQFVTKLKMKSMTVALVGRNLLVFSKVKHVDPETFGYASESSDFGYGTKVPGYANSSMPSVRSYGFTLNIKL
jgi:TonB-linked SusC/RagA family outer membrane protein